MASSEALRLYRAIYRVRLCRSLSLSLYGSASVDDSPNARLPSQAAAQMPTRDRRNYVRRRLRFEYEQHREETRPERLECVCCCRLCMVGARFWAANVLRECVAVVTRTMRRFLLRLAETQVSRAPSLVYDPY